MSAKSRKWGPNRLWHWLVSLCQRPRCGSSGRQQAALGTRSTRGKRSCKAGAQYRAVQWAVRHPGARVQGRPSPCACGVQPQDARSPASAARPPTSERSLPPSGRSARCPGPTPLCAPHSEDPRAFDPSRAYPLTGPSKKRRRTRGAARPPRARPGVQAPERPCKWAGVRVPPGPWHGGVCGEADSRERAACARLALALRALGHGRRGNASG